VSEDRPRAGVAGARPRARGDLQLLDGAAQRFLFAPAPRFHAAEVSGPRRGQWLGIVRGHPAVGRNARNPSGSGQTDGGIGALLRQLRRAAAADLPPRAEAVLNKQRAGILALWLIVLSAAAIAAYGFAT